MSLKRVRTVQAHYVPEVAYTAHGPSFDIDSDSQIIREYDPGDPAPGATVLNNMQGVEMYICEVCGVDVAESEFDGHHC